MMIGRKWEYFSILFILVILMMLLIVLSVCIGEIKIVPWDAVKTLIGFGFPNHQLLIVEFRLPRVVMSIIAGAALAFSGAILQALTRNPLASPDVIGITGGASAAAVTLITFFTAGAGSLSVSIHWLPLVTFIGATLTAFLLYSVAWREGVTPIRFVLIGIGFYTITQALTNLVVLLGPPFRAIQAKTWLTGSIYGTSWEYVWALLPWAFLLFPLAMFWAKQMNIHQLSEEISIGLGSKLQRERLGLLILSTGFAGAAIAFVGGISFIGLVAPHAARRLVGTSYYRLLPVAGLLGAILVLSADFLGRTLFAPLEVPAGVFTAIVGTPYFLYLLFQERTKG